MKEEQLKRRRIDLLSSNTISYSHMSIIFPLLLRKKTDLGHPMLNMKQTVGILNSGDQKSKAN